MASVVLVLISSPYKRTKGEKTRLQHTVCIPEAYSFILPKTEVLEVSPMHLFAQFSTQVLLKTVQKTNCTQQGMTHAIKANCLSFPKHDILIVNNYNSLGSKQRIVGWLGVQRSCCKKSVKAIEGAKAAKPLCFMHSVLTLYDNIYSYMHI